MPRPLTGTKTKSGSLWWQCGHTTSGGMENAPHREHRATASTCAAAASQNGADRSSGTGTGRRRRRHGITPSSLQRADLLPRVAELEQDHLGVLAVLGGAAQRRRPLVELHRHGRQPVRRTAFDGDLAEVVVGEHLRIVEQLLDRLHRRPRRVDAREQRLPLLERAARELASSSATHSAACSRRACEVDEAGVVDELVAADQAAEVGPVPVGLEEHELDVATVLRPVRADERVHVRSRAAASRAACCPCSAASTSDDSVHIAVASSDTSTTEPLPVRVALEQRGGDAERQRHRTVAVTHRAALADRLVHLRRA